METNELHRLIRETRAANRAFLAHHDHCPTCSQWDYEAEGHRAVQAAYERLGREPRVSEIEEPDPPCEEWRQFLTIRAAARDAATTAARALGYNSPTAYERAHGKVS